MNSQEIKIQRLKTKNRELTGMKLIFKPYINKRHAVRFVFTFAVPRGGFLVFRGACFFCSDSFGPVVCFSSVFLEQVGLVLYI
jgi:hypothetical protein